jgi:organic hydroperoxide reductase OsmC/OhrA
MKFDSSGRALRCATETVWDGGCSGTGVCADGHELSLGRGDGGWTPEQLLLLGAESSLMEAVLTAARDAGVDVLGYISSGHLDVPDEAGGAPRLSLNPCVIVASVDEAQRAALLSTAVADASLVGRLLGGRLQVGIDVRLEPSA